MLKCLHHRPCKIHLSLLERIANKLLENNLPILKHFTWPKLACNFSCPIRFGRSPNFRIKQKYVIEWNDIHKDLKLRLPPGSTGWGSRGGSSVNTKSSSAISQNCPPAVFWMVRNWPGMGPELQLPINVVAMAGLSGKVTHFVFQHYLCFLLCMSFRIVLYQWVYLNYLRSTSQFSFTNPDLYAAEPAKPCISSGVNFYLTQSKS